LNYTHHIQLLNWHARRGSDTTAASGGRREGSEWPRSARDEGRKTEDIRWEPQQDTTTAVSGSSKLSSKMARQEGLEPPTYCLEA